MSGSGGYFWLGVGLLGQTIFTARFVVQWLASEKKRDSVIPVAFWWLSLIGGLTTFVYAAHRGDPVFMLGQSLGVVVYLRNLVLVHQKQSRSADSRPEVNESHAIPAPHLSLRDPSLVPEGSSSLQRTTS